VPGPSLKVCVRAVRGFIVGLVGLGFGVAALGAVTGGHVPIEFVRGAVVLMFIALAGLGAALAVAARQRRREADQGYTTAPTAFFNLATVDDRTGVVLRQAGTPLFTIDGYKAARSRAREAVDR
jgi:hypothetical protein